MRSENRSVAVLTAFLVCLFPIFLSASDPMSDLVSGSKTDGVPFSAPFSRSGASGGITVNSLVQQFTRDVEAYYAYIEAGKNKPQCSLEQFSDFQAAGDLADKWMRIGYSYPEVATQIQKRTGYCLPQSGESGLQNCAVYMANQLFVYNRTGNLDPAVVADFEAWAKNDYVYAYLPQYYHFTFWNDFSRMKQAAEEMHSSAIVPKKKIRVYLLAGQSNMVGCGSYADLPAIDSSLNQLQEKIPAVSFGYGYDYGLGPLKPGIGGGFGCELSFGKRMAAAYPQEEIALIKGSRGATDLAKDWLPPSAGGPGTLYSHFVASASQAIAELQKNFDVELLGMLWMQGESDGLNQSYAEAYEENLKCFIADIRSHFGAPNLPFVIAMIDDDPALWPYTKTIRQAEMSIVAKVPNVLIFDTKDFPKLSSEPAHYNSQGVIDMGNRFADKFLGLQ